MKTLFQDTQQVNIEILKSDFRTGNMFHLKERCKKITETERSFLFQFSDDRQLTMDTYIGLFDHYHRQSDLSVTDADGNEVILPARFTWFSRNMLK